MPTQALSRLRRLATLPLLLASLGCLADGTLNAQARPDTAASALPAAAAALQRTRQHDLRLSTPLSETWRGYAGVAAERRADLAGTRLDASVVAGLAMAVGADRELSIAVQRGITREAAPQALTLGWRQRF